MAFTEAQKAKIRIYHGLPIIESSDTTLETMIVKIGETAAHQAEVEDVLLSLAGIETEIRSLVALTLAESAEGSRLDPNRDRNLRIDGRRECQRLAGIFGTQIARDIFAGRGGGSFFMGCG